MNLFYVLMQFTDKLNKNNSAAAVSADYKTLLQPSRYVLYVDN